MALAATKTVAVRAEKTVLLATAAVAAVAALVQELPLMNSEIQIAHYMLVAVAAVPMLAVTVALAVLAAVVRVQPVAAIILLLGKQILAAVVAVEWAKMVQAAVPALSSSEISALHKEEEQ